MIFVNWFIFVREHLITPAIFYTRGPLQTSSALTALIYTLVIAELTRLLCMQVVRGSASWFPITMSTKLLHTDLVTQNLFYDHSRDMNLWSLVCKQFY